MFLTDLHWQEMMKSEQQCLWQKMFMRKCVYDIFWSFLIKTNNIYFLELWVALLSPLGTALWDNSVHQQHTEMKAF